MWKMNATLSNTKLREDVVQVYVNTDDQATYFLTKVVNRKKLLKIVLSNLSIVNIYAPTRRVL